MLSFYYVYKSVSVKYLMRSLLLEVNERVVTFEPYYRQNDFIKKAKALEELGSIFGNDRK